jgi:hypothetical protein
VSSSSGVGTQLYATASIPKGVSPLEHDREWLKEMRTMVEKDITFLHRNPPGTKRTGILNFGTPQPSSGVGDVPRTRKI